MVKGKKIVIVGGSSGIGLEVARALVEGGSDVTIGARSESKLFAAKAQLGVDVRVVDVANTHSLDAFAQSIGMIDHLIVTVKPQLPSAGFLDNDIDLVRNAFDVKFWGQYRLAKLFAPKINPNGSIVLTSGIAAQRSYPGYSAVSAMNAAVEALSKAIAVELAPIRVNTVSPGFVDTKEPSSGRLVYVKKLGATLPFDRLGTSSELAQAYLYLLSSSYSTGSVVVLDGGATC